MPPIRKSYRFTKRILKCLDNASVVNLLIECVRDYHSNSNLVPVEKRPTEEEIQHVIIEVLTRMENGHPEDPMKDN